MSGGGPPPGAHRRAALTFVTCRHRDDRRPSAIHETGLRPFDWNRTARTCLRVHATSELYPLDRCDFGQTAARPPRFVAVSPCLRGKSSFNPSARSLYAPHPQLRCRADYAPHLSATLRARRRGLRLPGRAARRQSQQPRPACRDRRQRSRLRRPTQRRFAREGEVRRVLRHRSGELCRG